MSVKKRALLRQRHRRDTTRNILKSRLLRLYQIMLALERNQSSCRGLSGKSLRDLGHGHYVIVDLAVNSYLDSGMVKHIHFDLFKARLGSYLHGENHTSPDSIISSDVYLEINGHITERAHAKELLEKLASIFYFSVVPVPNNDTTFVIR